MGIRRRGVVVRVCLLVVLVSITSAAVASAQGTSAPSRPWEISFSGGVLSGHGVASGTGQMPPPGDIYVTVLPGFAPSRLVSSWWFGDGALLFNELRNGLPSSPVTPALPSILPLDETLQRGIARRGAGLVFGIGVARTLTERLTAEFRVDVSGGGVSFDDEVRPAAEATRQSLEAAFGSAVFGGTISSNTDITTVEEGGRELLAVGALRIALAHGRSVEPYVVIGGGVARALGDGPTLNLLAHIGFAPQGVPQLDEVDAVTITAHPKLGAVVVAGGGLRKSIGARSGIRVDARVHFIGDTTTTEVDAAPENHRLTSSAFIFGRSSGTYSIVFSGLPEAPSSLSVPIGNFETFTASGMRTQFSLTLGYDIRF